LLCGRSPTAAAPGPGSPPFSSPRPPQLPGYPVVRPVSCLMRSTDAHCFSWPPATSRAPTTRRIPVGSRLWVVLWSRQPFDMRVTQGYSQPPRHSVAFPTPLANESLVYLYHLLSYSVRHLLAVVLTHSYSLPPRSAVASPPPVSNVAPVIR